MNDIDIDAMAKALHEELKEDFGAHVRGYNEPLAYGPGSGWCHCRSVMERIIKKARDQND